MLSEDSLNKIITFFEEEGFGVTKDGSYFMKTFPNRFFPTLNLSKIVVLGKALNGATNNRSGGILLFIDSFGIDSSFHMKNSNINKRIELVKNTIPILINICNIKYIFRKIKGIVHPTFYLSIKDEDVSIFEHQWLTLRINQKNIEESSFIFGSDKKTEYNLYDLTEFCKEYIDGWV